MKLTDKKLNKLVEIVTKDLRKKLKRDPTEKEIAEKLPLFLCKHDKEDL